MKFSRARLRRTPTAPSPVDNRARAPTSSSTASGAEFGTTRAYTLQVLRRLLVLACLTACSDAVGDRPFGDAGVIVDAGDAGVVPEAGVDASDAAPPSRGKVRVATFNLHLLFDTVCDSGNCGPGAFEEVSTQAALDARIVELANGIAKLDADVVMLEEIENAAVFVPLRDRLATLGTSYVTAELGETGAPASVDVAIFARGPAKEIRRHRGDTLMRPDGTTTVFSRELLEARLTIANRSVIAFAAHFRSKVDDDAGRRFAEAARTHELMVAAAAEDPSALVVLAGDLNDIPGSDPLNALEANDALVRVARDIGPTDQITYAHGNLAQAIDHIYVTSANAPRYVPRSAFVDRTITGSDHWPIRADFDPE